MMVRSVRMNLLALTLLAGCHQLAQPSPVRIQGESADIRRLIGTWRGEFLNPDSRRVGTIELELRAERDTAVGSVTFNRLVPTLACTDMSRAQTVSEVVLPVVLRIGGLATDNGSVGGWLLPYRDPDLGCWMDTWFEGQLRRDTLQGTFFTRRTDLDTVRSGTWWAARTQR